MLAWYEGEACEEDVVVSTRVRLARNLKDYNFPKLLNLTESDQLTDEVLNLVKNDLEDNYKFFKLSSMEKEERISFVEKHLISIDLVENFKYSSFLLRDDEKINIMINEEDHIRIQGLNPGLNFKDTWSEVDRTDDFLESKLDYAYHKDYGYLTACPSNLGTGLRVSVMLHLPALNYTNNLPQLIDGLRKLGLTVRGIYGEGTKGFGDFYQISNQITLGQSEEEIMDRLEGVTYQIIEKERALRNYLLEKKRIKLEDKIFRSLGILSNARVLYLKEALEHLSNLRFAIEAEVIDSLDYKDIMKLVTDIQIGNIKESKGKEDLSKVEIERANIVREYLKDKEV